MIILKQSTGGTLKIGPFLDEDDGKTTETGLTIPQSAVRLTKLGGNFAQKDSGTAASHDEFGWYDVPYNGTDANTVGSLLVAIHGTGALPVWREFQVVEEDTYEFLMASGATPDTDVASILADTNELQADDYPTSIAALPTAVENRQEMDSNSTQLAAIVADTNELQVDDYPTLIAALPTAVENRQEMDSNSTQLAAIVADTNELQVDDYPTTIAAVQTVVNAILDDTGTSGVKVGADAIGAAQIADYAILAINVGTDAIGAAQLATAAAQEIRAEMDSNSTQLAAIVADTNELQVDDYPTLIAALPTAVENRQEMDSNSTQLAAIVADTNELQVDDYPTSIAAIQSDTDDIQNRIPAALSSGNIKADALAISTSTAAADNLEASAETIVTGAAEGGTLSTTEMTTDLTEATNDHYNGRVVIWTSGVLANQASDITDYLGSTGKLTYTAVTEAPSAADTFVIV